MSSQTALIRREMRAQPADIVGTVISHRALSNFDGEVNGAAMWVVDVEIGANRVLRDVPVKASSTGGREYAARGQSVVLRRNAQGRYDLVGPADRKIAFTVSKQYDLTLDVVTATASLGFTFERKAFNFFKGPTPPTAGTSLWNDGNTSFPHIIIVDADGNEVT